MADGAANPGQARLPLDELVGLNDEIAAMLRAGVPLHVGLRALGRNLPGRSGSMAEELGIRLERGESLETALRAPELRLPPVYQAVVAAGLRSGRLASALEGLSASAARQNELRRHLGTALLYPVVVLLATYALFVLFTTSIVPALVDMQEFNAPASPYMKTMQQWGESARYWAPWPPVLFLIGIAIAVVRTAQLGAGTSRWNPWGRFMRAVAETQFAEMLALLIEHHTPLDEAVAMAGAASGDQRVATAATEFAEFVRRGAAATRNTAHGDGDSPAAHEPFAIWMQCRNLPPLIGWALFGARSDRSLVDALKRLAQRHRRRAEGLADWLSSRLPLTITVVVGAAAGLFFAAAVLIPWVTLLMELVKPWSG